VKRLEQDKVPNVQINLIKCYIALKNFLSPQIKKDWQQIAKKFKESKDEDVVYYASKCEE
jgi:hypothetical protein